MNVDRILISAAPGETRIVELDDGNMVGLTIDRAGQKSLVGDIIAGRVEAVIHNLQAAFVDIGLERSGYLGLPDARPHGAEGDDGIGDYLSEGDRVLVQVSRDPQEDKGAKLTMKTVLTGRDLVFTPGRPGISLSRRISNEEERDRLTSAMADFQNADGGYIVRTAAQEAETEDITGEAARLQARWVAIDEVFRDAVPPACLERELEPACQLLRDQGGIDLTAIVVDDADVYSRIKAFAEAEMPDIADLVNMYRGDGPLFDAEGVEEMIDDALDPWVALPSGGNIRINETDALIAVDVNTGGAAGGNREQLMTDVNCEAAAAFAQQIRLRNLSGLMVIDFVTMRREENQQKVLRALQAALADDPHRPFMGGFTRFGLVELTRRRKGLSLTEILCGGPAAPVKSAMTTALEALRAVLRAAEISPGAGIALELAQAAAGAMKNEVAEAYELTRERLGGQLEIHVNASMKPDGFLVLRDGAAT